MSTRLLDVNVLIALMDSAHVHHEPAVDWFRQAGASEAWATCPLTEMGFIRVTTSFSYPNRNLTAATAGDLLKRFQQGFPGKHHFWIDETGPLDASALDLSVITGSRQLTDVCLAALAHRKHGRLATLDSGKIWHAVLGANADLVERIPT